MFVVMKVTEMLVQPLHLALLALVAVAALLGRGRIRPARRLLALVLVALGVLAAAPWGAWLLEPLENRFAPPPTLPERVDGIVVLGGAIEPVQTAARGQIALNGSAERLVAMVQLARRYPDARLVYTGGSGSVGRQDLKEAPLARQLLDSLGVDTGRVMFEDQSRNTWENAVKSRVVAQPAPGQTWLLVTSALHMPRAVGAFRAAGWSVLPYPVDYITAGSGGGIGFNLGGGASTLRQGLHEWAGLVYYRLRGWSDSWYPGL